MTYQETLDYLYAQLPMFQRVGKSAFKKDLSNTIRLLEVLGNPHTRFKSIHIAGTNGKGTSAHSVAAILQAAGFKTGLYTSPHLRSFTERIKINGEEVSQQFVIDFIHEIKPHLEEIKPSFFETTVAMAFHYFASQSVDIAVVEVGMGGRLDSTNVIEPLISLITMIGKDHQDFLGNTLAEIAGEKAGIIKPGKPVVIGADQPDIRFMFTDKAAQCQSPIIFAADQWTIETGLEDGLQVSQLGVFKYHLQPDIQGQYYVKNLPGILSSIEELRKCGFDISDNHVTDGLAKVSLSTGLKGRWQILQREPLMICDVGHNPDGLRENMRQIEKLSFADLHFVIGGVKDKKWEDIFPLLPKNATYYIAEPKIPRAINAEALHHLMSTAGFQGSIIKDVNQAIASAKAKATKNDLIFIGGSTFVVAEIENL